MQETNGHRNRNMWDKARAIEYSHRVIASCLLSALCATALNAAELQRSVLIAPRSVVVGVQDYVDARLIDVLGQLSSACEEQSGQKLKISVPIDYLVDIYYVRVTFRAIDETLRETLEKLTQLSHLQFELVGETVNVRLNPSKERRLPERVY